MKQEQRASGILESNAKGIDMLVLSRHDQESIMIGDDIEIMVLSIRGDKVRLGIGAPKEMPVHRKEVYDAIKRREASDETAS